MTESMDPHDEDTKSNERSKAPQADEDWKRNDTTTCLKPLQQSTLHED